MTTWPGRGSSEATVRILAPAESAEQAVRLIEAGAGALYFGYQPSGWQESRSPLEALNRRTFASAQVPGEEEVAALLGRARERGVPAWAVFNASHYPEGFCQTVVETARWLAGLGCSGFIVSDPALILAMRDSEVGPLCLSTMGAAFNASAVAFYRDLGVERFTLPRHLTAAEVAEVAGAHPGVPFDVFALFGACANIEPFCRWAHENPERIWPCVREWVPEPGAGVDDGMKQAATAQAAWSGLSRAWACGLCALRDLSRVPNVEGLKIVGRGAPLSRKLAGVRMLSELLDRLEEPDGEFLARARDLKLRESGSGCDPRLCYFPEYLVK